VPRATRRRLKRIESGRETGGRINENIHSHGLPERRLERKAGSDRSGWIPRRRNLRDLYDKDADGEYLQLYTRSFKDLFFLEIVERRGYKGFGAINAPIRLSRLAPAPAATGL
jgi:hypothetical protein